MTDYMQFDEDDPTVDMAQAQRDELEELGAFDDENVQGEVVELFDGLTPYQRGVADVVGNYADEVMGGRRG